MDPRGPQELAAEASGDPIENQAPTRNLPCVDPELDEATAPGDDAESAYGYLSDESRREEMVEYNKLPARN